jgi:curved DNA-binding protein
LNREIYRDLPVSVQYQDYYKVLGIDRKAPQSEVKKAYRKLAREYHPDINKEKSAEGKFKAITEAYEVLGDPEKRKKYDTLGSNWRAGQEFTPPPGWENIFSGFSGVGGQQGASFSFGDLGGFSDFFGMLFGNGSSFHSAGNDFAKQYTREKPQAGQTHEAIVTLSLEDIYRGGKKSISLEAVETNPSGQVQRNVRNYQITIPKGIKEGSSIRLKGQGGKGVGGSQAGDILLKIKIAPHKQFRASGYDVYSTVSITPWEAILGTKIKVKTLDGEVTLTIPAGAQNGQQLRLRGKGLFATTSSRGDMLVEIKISVPKSITEKEKQLIEELSKISTFNPRTSY